MTNANRELQVVVDGAKVVVGVAGASAAAVDAAVVIVAVAGAAAIGLTAFGLFKLLTSND